MLTIPQSAFLGIVQGLTEFLPISSSGHLILFRELLGVNTQSGLAFDAILQLGTILAVFLYFRRDIARLARAAFRFRTWRTPDLDQKLLIGIFIGTIPALLLGLVLEQTMETVFRSAFLVAWTLIAGSLLMWFAERRFSNVERQSTPSLRGSLWIGCFQVLALVPGMSRSGSTISGGLLLGLSREAATRFSFLLSLPIITGSGLLKLVKVIKSGATDFNALGLAVGFAAAFGVGYLCIAWLIRFLKTHSLLPFVWYRMGVAAAVFLAISAS